MESLELTGVPLFIRRMMPIATSCPLLPVRSEILFALLLLACLTAELIAPIAVHIVSVALFVPLAVAIVVFRRFSPIERKLSGSSIFLQLLAARPPPVS
jgi:hypothetical protein